MTDVLEMKHMAEREAHDEQEKYTLRESAVKAMLDRIVALCEDRFNIIIVRDYRLDAKHFVEAAPAMPTFRIEYAKGQFDTFRVYLFTEGSYDRPGFGPSWEGDGIQWYPPVEANKQPGCMYLQGFPTKPGMTEQERREAGERYAEKANEEKNDDLDRKAEMETNDQLRQMERERWAAEVLDPEAAKVAEGGQEGGEGVGNPPPPSNDGYQGDGGDVYNAEGENPGVADVAAGHGEGEEDQGWEQRNEEESQPPEEEE
jgi:hypothetical protein